MSSDLGTTDFTRVFPANIVCGTDGDLTDCGRTEAAVRNDGYWVSCAEDIYVPVEEVEEAADEYMNKWREDIADILLCHNLSATQRAAVENEKRLRMEARAAREPKPP